MTTMPAEITYGHVTGRFIAAWTDGPDSGRLPDPRPLEGLTVKITPKVQMRRLAGASPVLVATMPVTCKVDADGVLIDEQDTPGVWLVTGVYGVTYSHPSVAIPAHDIEVTDAHTEGAPLDLVTAMPPGGPVLTASQYAELTARIDGIVVEAGGVSSVNGQTGAVTLDAADVGALPDSTPIPSTPADIGAATAAQGALADTAVQPADVTDVIREGDARLTDARTPTSHTHAYADITDPPTIPGPQTLSLAGSDLTLSDGGGTVTLPSGGGGGGSAWPQVAPESPRIFFPPFANTGTSALNQNIYAVPIEVPYGSITEIGIEVTTAAASSVLRLGLYAPWGNGTWPKTRIVDAGTVDVSATGWKNIVLPAPIAWTGGLLYAVAYRPSTSTNPQVRTATGASQRLPIFYGNFANAPTSASINSTGFYMTGNHDAGLPATFTPANQNFAAILMGVRVA